jgi:hypothetical protein
LSSRELVLIGRGGSGQGCDVLSWGHLAETVRPRQATFAKMTSFPRKQPGATRRQPPAGNPLAFLV